MLLGASAPKSSAAPASVLPRGRTCARTIPPVCNLACTCALGGRPVSVFLRATRAYTLTTAATEGGHAAPEREPAAPRGYLAVWLLSGAACGPKGLYLTFKEPPGGARDVAAEARRALGLLGVALPPNGGLPGGYAVSPCEAVPARGAYPAVWLLQGPKLGAGAEAVPLELPRGELRARAVERAARRALWGLLLPLPPEGGLPRGYSVAPCEAVPDLTGHRYCRLSGPACAPEGLWLRLPPAQRHAPGAAAEARRALGGLGVALPPGGGLPEGYSVEPHKAMPTPEAPKRVLGVDYGRSRTGLALAAGSVQALQTISNPPSVGLSEVARQVVGAALRHRVEAIVVGVPVQPGGSIVKPHTDSPTGRRCRSLGHTLALMCKEHGLSVYLYDETGTTRAAAKSMGYNWQDSVSKEEKQARRIDPESAAMLLRLYLGDPRQAVRINPLPKIHT